MELDLSDGVGSLPGRRRRSAEERWLIVEQALEPVASVARVARKHGVNANQMFTWKRLYKSCRLGVPISRMRLLPVRVVEEHAAAKEIRAGAAPTPPGTVHIEMPGRALSSLERSFDPAMICAVPRSLGS